MWHLQLAKQARRGRCWAEVKEAECRGDYVENRFPGISGWADVDRWVDEAQQRTLDEWESDLARQCQQRAEALARWKRQWAIAEEARRRGKEDAVAGAQ